MTFHLKCGLANARFERKFLPSGLSVAETIALVRRHPALFREPYPERVVNNVYFDTPDLRHFHDHVGGTARRFKVRIRWYGDFGGAIAQPRLEFKLRRGTVSGKEGYPFPPFELNGHFPRGVLEAAWHGDALPEQARLRLHGVQAVLGNRYRRRYFCTADGAVRLTVDWGLEFIDLRGVRASLRPLSGQDHGVIVEVKYADACAADAAAVTACFPFRLVRCSKYVLGVQRLDGMRD
ncbi:MAG TPA: VTC domain-containing protein [Verrucomicrobiota bacterium]|nr:VTC domain-containing protein [Verrucomicrobiota bacterium]HRZ35064.1 VTC domain-containing protein [Candidatus Paceibacterota bacterium]HRZ54986.1 VTC domain-containing protein [Candidatus Paceibacterota bacterium]